MLSAEDNDLFCRVATSRVIGRGEPYIPHATLRSFEGVPPEELALAPIGEAGE